MHLINIIYCCTYAIIGILIIGLSIPLVKDKIKKNYWYGFRIPKAYTSDENWYAINRYGGQRFIRWGPLFFCFSILSLIVPLESSATITILFGFLPVIIILFPIIEVLIYARKI